MKCVPRENCDFAGVMTDMILRLTPELEMLRVPLIVSFSSNQRVDMNLVEFCPGR